MFVAMKHALAPPPPPPWCWVYFILARALLSINQ